MMLEFFRAPEMIRVIEQGRVWPGEVCAWMKQSLLPKSATGSRLPTVDCGLWILGSGLCKPVF